MVICGSSRRSLENPLSRNPSPASVSKYRVEHVVEHQAGRAQPGVRGARRGDLLPPRVLREHAQPPRHGPVRDRRHARFLQHPRAVQLADRLDDPGQHQLAEHLVPARGPVEAQHPPGVLQRVQQAAHPRRGDRQRPARRAGVQAQVQLALPGRQPLPRGRFQQLQLRVVMRRAEVLDIPRPAPRRMHDLHRRRARGRLHRPQIRGHQPRIRPRLVRNFSNHQDRTRRSATREQDQVQKVAEVRTRRTGWSIHVHVRRLRYSCWRHLC